MSDQRFNTGNPIGSNSPLDRSDNTRNLDLAVNSSDAEWSDRFDQPRLTFAGMQSQFSLAQELRNSQFHIDQAERASEFDADQAERENDFDAAQDDREQRFNAFIASSGYQFLGDYAAGLELTEYNQLVRDESGEFWRVAGQVDLPYVTTGDGIPEGGALVPAGDAVLRQDLASPGGHRLVANQMAASAYGAPAKAVNVRNGVDAPIVVDYFHGYFWGSTSGNNINRSIDGETWELFSTNQSFTPARMIPTSDSEVLALATNAEKVYKSIGWTTGNPTWKLVLENPSPPNQVPFTRMGFDGHGSKFIITHYGAGPANWANSRYVWISTDAGETWDIVWDTQAQFPGLSGGSHLHAACYDPWADRFYFTEGHGTPLGIYYSDDDGANWTKVPNMSLNPAPTTMTAAEFGIVMGTDSEPNGVVLLPRTDAPDGDDIVFLAANDTAGRSGVLGFADRSMRDPDTGIVYVAFNSSFADIPVVVFGVGSGGASVILSEGYGSSSINRFSNVVAAKGRILATHNIAGNVVADLPPYTSEPKPFDTGNVMPETRSTRQAALAVGRNARAEGLNSLAVGAIVGSGQDSVAIGFRGVDLGTSPNATAVGNTSSAGSNATAVGYGAEGISGSAAYGYLAKATGAESVALGLSSKSLGVYSLAIGRLADVKSAGTYSVALGSAATAGSPNCVSLGYQTHSGGDWSTALGANASATGGGSVAVGYSSSATSSGTSVGRETVSGANGVAVGREANTVVQGISIGQGAEVESQGGIAIGRMSKVGLGTGSSVAIGQNSEAQRPQSVCVGERHIESTRAGGQLILRSPDGTPWAITVDNTGAISATSI